MPVTGPAAHTGARAVLMTGAGGGIGARAALALLRDPHRHLVVAGRGDIGAVAAGLAADSGNRQVHPVRLDLASLAAVRDCADVVRTLLESGSVPPLQGIVTAAGVQNSGTHRATDDGIELTFGVNVIGHYLLLRLVAERLRAPARVVLVTGAAHGGTVRCRFGTVLGPRWRSPSALAEPGTGARARGWAAGQVAYATSMLALVYLAHELARRAPDGIDVYSFDPGLVPGTGIGAGHGRAVRTAWQALAPVLRRLPRAVDAPVAGAALAAACVGPKPTAEVGAYLYRGRAASSAPASYRMEREGDLWSVAARLVGLPER